MARFPTRFCAVLAYAALACTGARADDPRSPSAPLREVVAIADAFLPSLDVDPAQHKLVAVQNMHDGKTYKGPAYWRVTYKSCGAQPVDVEPVCKGGEIYVAVDMTSRTASFIGAGE